MALCTLCGCEVSFLTQKVIHLCSTEQPLCGECWKRYDRADAEEQPRIRERILASPHLRKREKVMEFLAENREAIARRDRARVEEKQRLDDLSIRMKTVLRCCDTPMEYLGQGSYTQYPIGLFIAATPRTVDVFECPVCGQVKFFNTAFVPDALREKEEPNV